MSITLFNRKALFISLLISFILIGITSCRYSFTGASISPDIKTISVDFFRSYVQSPPFLEQSFTEALKEIFISQSNLHLVADGGDLHFEGKITGYTLGQPVSVSADQIASTERLTITVRVKFTNSKEPKKSFDRSFSRFKDYDASQNITSIENDLITDINKQLVQTVFDAAVSNW